MTETAHLGLPFIEGSQAQKHVTHNEALRILDAAIQIGVLETALTAPPASPAEGARYIVAAGATGNWADHDAAIATFEDGAWRFLMPKPGWCAWSAADEAMFVFDGTVWRDLHDLPAMLANVPSLGVNATASGPNLLTVHANAALLYAIAAADGGSGDTRLQISKEGAANTASVVFSDHFSGRAEFGLVESDAFKLKVSADGASFVEALAIDQTTGNATLPRGVALTGVIAPPQLTADVDDYAPAGLESASVIRLSADAVRNIGGLAGGSEGRVMCFVNTGAFAVILKDESAGSAAINRFGFGSDLTLGAKQGALLVYDGNAARWRLVGGAPGSGSDAGTGTTPTERQNAELTSIYQSRICAEYRRLVNRFATGFKGASDTANGINTGSSSNYAVNASSGYVAPTTSGTTVTINPAAGTAAGQGFTVIDLSTKVLNSRIVAKLGAYSTAARNVTLKIVRRNAANNYDVAVNQTFAHAGGGWQDFDLVAPYTVPATGDYYLGMYCPAGGANPNVTVNTVSRAQINSDLVGTGVATTAEDTNIAFPLRYIHTMMTDNMTLATASQTADATVSNARVLLEFDNTATPALNSDLTVEVTCDGGVNWAAATPSPMR